MFSQHPDHASVPFWHHQALIETFDEIKECFLAFNDLGGDEVMWDWEGKLVDEAVIERLFGKYTQFFKDSPIGKDVFLTFRVPNPRVEPGYRLGRAFMVIISGQFLAESAGFPNTPLFEVILPMTESAKEMIGVQRNFTRLSKAIHRSFGSNGLAMDKLEIIPIFESVETILNSGKIIKKYARTFERQFKTKLPYLRPFCARSDPALNSGIVPTTLAIKWALSEYAKFSKETGIPTHPVIAPGALPFRGGLTPKTAMEFMQEFAGVQTLVIQSAFRYDYPLEEVKASIGKIQKSIKGYKTKLLPEDIIKEIRKIIPHFEKPYRESVEKFAPLIQKVAAFIPQRRERVQHIGLFGYSRQVGQTKLPRAIGFTAGCYSLGIPPELIGTGRGIKKIKNHPSASLRTRRSKIKIVEELYLELKSALLTAGRYLSKDSLKKLNIPEIEEDVEAIEEYLGEKLGPKNERDFEHEKLVKKIIFKLGKGQNPQKEIEKAAIIRQSLG